MDNILLVANTSYAGMGPYVASIVNSFEPEDGVRFFLVEDNGEYYQKNIKKELLPFCTFFRIKKNKIRTLINLTIQSKCLFHNQLKKEVEKYEINCVHCLTSFHDEKFVKWFNRRGRFIMTVHDLIQHESKKAFYKEFRENVLFKRMTRCISSSKYLVTNNSSQFEMLIDQFPDKKVAEMSFPTLVTDYILSGNAICVELSNEKDYILFFGRIEEYKGLKLLVEAYLSANPQRKLVIAGKGDFPGKITHPNIIYLNRYIDDSEIKALYENALYVVYPYISATQSGVLSLASFFKKPILVSDITFFKETIGNSKCAIFFKSGDVDSLSDAIKQMETSDFQRMSEASEKLYYDIYSSKNYKESLIRFYTTMQ